MMSAYKMVAEIVAGYARLVHSCVKSEQQTATADTMLAAVPTSLLMSSLEGRHLPNACSKFFSKEASSFLAQKVISMTNILGTHSITSTAAASLHSLH